MDTTNQYHISVESIRLSAYRLITIFYANIEVNRRSDPKIESLEQAFFKNEFSEHLIRMAVLIRLFEDQIRNQERSPEGEKYLNRLRHVNERFDCLGEFSEPKLTLRDVCNKIIHRTKFQFLAVTRQDGQHEHDYTLDFDDLGFESPSAMAAAGVVLKPTEPIEWRHKTPLIRLEGAKNGKTWWHLINIEEVVKAIETLFASD